ncbi:hypothetical protein [Hydrogenophaga sp.]|uniref:hypothetical protein n=1 Tax=Hydrogenophaga sp. TaxID=1904254 RepID=UPI00356201A2
MPEDLDLFASVFAKTAAGQQEIQSRALGLPPIVRRILVLVDGQRSGKDLAPFATGSDILSIMEQLIAQGCVEVKERIQVALAPAAGPAATDTSPAAGGVGAGADGYLASLPDAATRTAADAEMARNFMINTVNTVFGQNMRLTLIQSIFEAKGTEGLRKAYLSWAESMASSRIGEKRLPELREKLSKVL